MGKLVVDLNNWFWVGQREGVVDCDLIRPVLISQLKFKFLDTVFEFVIIIYYILKVLLSVKFIEDTWLHFLQQLIKERLVQVHKHRTHIVLWSDQALVLDTEAE